MMRKLTLGFSILMMTLVLSAPASADVVNLSLFSPTQAAAPGSVVSFLATVSAPGTNTAPIFLNGDSTTIDFPLTLDDSGFLFGFPLSLGPGDSFTGLLFTVDVPGFTPVNVAYHGSFDLQGGADSSTFGDLAIVNFEVDAVPEPGSLILLTTGLAGLASVVRRRQRL